MKRSILRMNRILLCALLLVSAGCAGDNGDDNSPDEGGKKPELTTETFPVIDGSDSTTPLRMILMCRLFGIDYTWQRRPFTQDPDEDIKGIYPQWGDGQNAMISALLPKLKASNTHGSFVNLIDNTVELILTARSISRDEKKYAAQQGVTLIEKPIARDAFIFMVNPRNTVQSLTIQQILQIYTGAITNWREVGGADAPICPYVRNANSGSQEKFETMVMDGLTIKDFPEMQVGRVMLSPYQQLKDDVNGIGFTPFYYYSVIVDNHTTRAIAVNGVEPNQTNIRNGAYPYVTNVYAAVRSDVDRNSPAYRLFAWLTTAEGQRIVEESGYVPLPKP